MASSWRTQQSISDKGALYAKPIGIAEEMSVSLPLYRRKSETSLLALFGRNRSVKMTEKSLHTDGISLRHQTSRNKFRAQSERADTLGDSRASWDPPALFKAYPQAVKYGRLRTPPLPAETILRLHQQAESTALKSDQISPNSDGSRATDSQIYSKKVKRSQSMVRERISINEWTPKIFVLATSGCLLQYSGDGQYNRQPEKILPLGKDSVAFASDAILGEHYVLQVSEKIGEKGRPVHDTVTSLFKKMRFRSDVGSLSSSLLLIADSPEDLNSWLVAIRKEIECLGGTKYRPDVLSSKTCEHNTSGMREAPSQRYLLKRDPNRFGNIPREFDRPVQASVHQSTKIKCRRPSMSMRESSKSCSNSSEAAKSSQTDLERSREVPRLLFAPVVTKKSSNSVGSPCARDPSPARAVFYPPDLIPDPVENFAAKGLRSKGLCLKTPNTPLSTPLPIPELGNQRGTSSLRSTSMSGFTRVTTSSVSTLSANPPPHGHSTLHTNGPDFPLRRSPSPLKGSTLQDDPRISNDMVRATNKESATSSCVASKLTTPSRTSKRSLIRTRSAQPMIRRWSPFDGPLKAPSRKESLTSSVSPQSPLTTPLPALPEIWVPGQKTANEGPSGYQQSITHTISRRKTLNQTILKARHSLGKTSLQDCPSADRSSSTARAKIGSIEIQQHGFLQPKPQQAKLPHSICVPCVKPQLPEKQWLDFPLLPNMSFLAETTNAFQTSIEGSWNPILTKV